MSQDQQAPVQALELIYATALLDLAEQADQAPAVLEEVRGLRELLEHSQELGRLFGSRILTREERAGSLERLFHGRVSDLLYRFLRVVNQKDRLAELPSILRAAEWLYDQRHGRLEVLAFVAKAMDAVQAEAVAQRLGAVLRGTVRLRQVVQPHLIGGLKLRVGDREIDGSVLTQLKLMRSRIMAAGREKGLRGALLEEAAVA